MTDVSIVIPMKNEADNIGPLLAEVAAACAGLDAYEIIVVDDGSTDDTAARGFALMSEHPALRVIRHGQSGGQSAAVHSGVRAANAEIICTLDGDGQNPPAELPKLFGPLLADKAGQLGLVAGQRVARQDTLSKRLASRVANGLRGWLLQDGTRDTGCGLKGFRREGFLDLPYFDHMHRYLPALFKRDGWEIALVDVSHRERQAGRSNYSNLQRALVGLYDLIGVAWLIRRRKKARPLDPEEL
ncbi:Dolichol-phosphate mannosyltransferase [Candidatus Rhodobacter oscarellae]|uniref:Dolichol-phosphate mannosyltransferase n=1 Tax=Candidatus Rhodobacter oscarellae TaxID=1675527 RepID=A0A0J9GZE7_9RHOB|nr:glycosyltransferase family 2 protein [Candidatus Rhodobacter lobularis]KMW58853.1 Dolichol-phosphate mannosyltransferase [Candidatus Rhodobacter lobularis]